MTAITARGSYEGDLLVGANGVSSAVGRTFGLNTDPILFALTEAEAEVSKEAQAAWIGRTRIDVSAWPLGYAWVCPKRGHLGVGIGAPRRYAKRLSGLLERFRRRAGLTDGRGLQQRGHVLGFHRWGAPLAHDRVLLIGDAAGLVDPNTGGGIGWALRSARLAAGAALSCLEGETPSLRAYTRLIDDQLEPELRAARVPRDGTILRFILTGGRATRHAGLWREAARVIQGEERYGDWYSRSRWARWLAWTGGIPLQPDRAGRRLFHRSRDCLVRQRSRHARPAPLEESPKRRQGIVTGSQPASPP